MKMRGPVGLGLMLLFTAVLGVAQVGSPNSTTNPYLGSANAEPLSADVRPLSIDDAIQLGIKHNLALELARQNQKAASGKSLNALNPLLPNLSLAAQTGVHQYNLEAQGFNPALGAVFGKLLGFNTSNFSLITKVDMTMGQVNYQQLLFSWSALDQYRAAKSDETAAYYNTQSARGLVVLNVGTQYLQALAASAEIDYAKALLAADKTLLDQAIEEHKAGTAANLDELRARVQYQTQEQKVIVDENNFEKAKIALNRQIGLDPEQKIQLTDAVPYADLEATSIEEAKQKAYANRQDYQSMIAQLRSASLQRSAAHHERLPTLTFGGFYGVQGISGSVYHGVFSAQGQLQVPIFQEAKFRGDAQVADTQLTNLRSQMADLRTKIDSQLRDSLLDVEATGELVRVARSNVDLATKTLDQTTDRFKAGVDDNLPVVQAQASLSSAQTQLVSSLFQFNQAKLGLARNLGLVDTQYKNYIH
jgi:outer membrane protein TolC